MTHGFDAASDSVEPAAKPAGAVAPVLAAINRVVVILSSIALVIAAIVLTYSVFSRYFFHFSTDWQDELSVFLIVGAVFMSGAAIQAKRGHVAIEAIVGLLPARTNHIRQLVVDFASFAFCAFFAWKSFFFHDAATTENYHSGSTWGPPLWIPYSLMSVGMTLLSLQLLLQVVAQLRGRTA